MKVAKEASIRVRISITDKKRLEAAARADQRTVSDWVRLRVLEALRK